MLAIWNYCFRQSVNVARSLYAYAPKGAARYTSEELTEAAVALCAGLKGKYRATPGGPLLPVQGDVSKLPMVVGLPEAARTILSNVRRASSSMPGTMEVRRLMQHETHAYRVVYGEPIFVTVSPSERDSFLGVRLFRCRRGDPVQEADEHAERWAGLEQPGLELAAKQEEAEGEIPCYEARRFLAARDPFSIVESFHVQLRLTLRHLFGVQICQDCLRCSTRQGGTPCQSVDGSAAAWRLGVFGHVDAVYASLEHQKAGSLHARMQVWVRCMHQQKSLREILADLQEAPGGEIVGKYLRYKQHVAREEYADAEEARVRREGVESDWPEYRLRRTLVTVPGYLGDGQLTKQMWEEEYWRDVQAVQELKQHHVHPYDAHGVRQLLQHCRRKDDRTACKARFPREHEMLDGPAVLCEGLARRLKLPTQGRRNALGSLVGPRNDEWLNGTHPALAVGLRANTDVQLPFRLPPCRSTRSPMCLEPGCLDDLDLEAITSALQERRTRSAAMLAITETRDLLQRTSFASGCVGSELWGSSFGAVAWDIRVRGA